MRYVLASALAVAVLAGGAASAQSYDPDGYQANPSYQGYGGGYERQYGNQEQYRSHRGDSEYRDRDDYGRGDQSERGYSPYDGYGYGYGYGHRHYHHIRRVCRWDDGYQVCRYVR